MAAITASVITAGAAVAGAVSGRKAAKKAGKQQAEAAEAGLAEQARQFDVTQGQLDPFREAGEAALGRERAFLGLGAPQRQFEGQTELDQLNQQISGIQAAGPPDLGRGLGGRFFTNVQGGRQEEQLAGLSQRRDELLAQQQALPSQLSPLEQQQQAFADFAESPGTQFLREQGLRGVEGRSAALGGLGGGERLKELTRFSQGLALQDFGNQFNRLSALRASGQSAAAGLGGLRSQQAASTAAGLQTAGAARALGGLGAQQATAQGAEQLIGQLPTIFGAFGGEGGNP